jgi:hypothetical protein
VTCAFPVCIDQRDVHSWPLLQTSINLRRISNVASFEAIFASGDCHDSAMSLVTRCKRLERRSEECA